MGLMGKTVEKIEGLKQYENIPYNLHDAENSTIVSIEVIEKENKSKTGHNEYYRLVVDHLGDEIEFEIYKGVKGKPQYGNSLDVIKAWIDSQHDEISYQVAGKTFFAKPSEDTDYWIGKKITIAKMETKYGFDPIFHLPKPDAAIQVGEIKPTLIEPPKPVTVALQPPTLAMARNDVDHIKWVNHAKGIPMSGDYPNLFEWLKSQTVTALNSNGNLVPCGSSIGNSQLFNRAELWDTTILDNIHKGTLVESAMPI